MTGGLIQMAAHGTQDVFLTGNPSVTFFKVVYRRHTNFSVESIPQYFVGQTNFGQEIVSTIERNGDLMGRIYLEITIPKVDLTKNMTHWKVDKNKIKEEFEKMQDLYRIVNEYIASNSETISKLESILKTDNISMLDIEHIMENSVFINNLLLKRNKLKTFISQNNFSSIGEKLSDFWTNLIYQINRFDIQIIFLSTIRKIGMLKNLSPDEISNRKKTEVLKAINQTLYPEMKDFYQKIYSIYVATERLYQSFQEGTYTERYQFAWVEELGHAIIDQIEIRIGHQLIDKHTGDWLIIFNKLYTNEHQLKNYHKMIGNIPELTLFNDNIKKSYKLVIPLQFWFCRYIGLSLPLISLRYHDVSIILRLKDLSLLCYVEDDPELVNIQNVQTQYNINIMDTKLYVDYIFLDSDERKRFAQTTHEYLIEVVHFNDFKNVIGNRFIAHLNFLHPTKYMIWFAQPETYRQNPSGINKCQWNNFGIYSNKTGFTMRSALLRLNMCNLTDPYLDTKYFNYVQPYLYFKHSPNDGLHVYSFAIQPMEHQPSGSINLGRIDDLVLDIVFTNEFIKILQDESIYLAVYALSYNILRIMGGMGGLAFR
jgi:hypothetical protein